MERAAPADMSNVASVDKQIFEMHNELRANPKSFIKDLEDMLDKFIGEQGLDYRRGAGRSTLRTKEGGQAVLEAIEFLKEQAPVQPLRWSNEMAEASKAHVMDIGPKGLIGHNSSADDKGTKERLRSFGNIISCYGESLSF